MNTRMLASLSAAALLGFAASASAATFFGPTAYLSAADTPANFYNSAGAVFLENFEDGTLDGGVTASAGWPRPLDALSDSVDADDGSIDGLGRSVSYFYGNGPVGVTFTFAEPVTAAGMVWTDGEGEITFEAFGPGMVSLGTVTGNHAGRGVRGETAEDRFYGVQNAAGITAIKLSNAGGGIEVDHLQYGAMYSATTPAPVPLPAAAPFMLAGLAALGLLRRRG